MLRRIACLWLTSVASAIPAEPHYFTQQLIDHAAAGSGTYSQRYYENATAFKGPGSPILMIMGGEGAIPPSTGLFYPWIVDVLASAFGALVIEPEHRFYGASMPFGNASLTPEHMRLLTPQQALADAVGLITHTRERLNCTAWGTPGYCPVLTFGGSYPGFLSAMMRLRYPAVVDGSYAASAPMRFYAQQVEQYAYYAVITKSAKRASTGCPAAVQTALELIQQAGRRSSDVAPP